MCGRGSGEGRVRGQVPLAMGRGDGTRPVPRHDTRPTCNKGKTHKHYLALPHMHCQTAAVGTHGAGTHNFVDYHRWQAARPPPVKARKHSSTVLFLLFSYAPFPNPSSTCHASLLPSTLPSHPSVMSKECLTRQNTRERARVSLVNTVKHLILCPTPTYCLT